MADQKMVRSALLITGVAAAGYFLWKYAQKGSSAPATDTKSPLAPSETAAKETPMTHILHIDSSARGSDSHSRTVSGELVEALKAANPGVTVT